MLELSAVAFQCLILLSVGLQPNAGFSLLIAEISVSHRHSDSTNDISERVISPTHTTNTKDGNPFPLLDSNPVIDRPPGVGSIFILVCRDSFLFWIVSLLSDLT